MVDWIKKIATAISEKGGFFMFIRAQFSSQIASLTDFAVTIILASFCNVYYVLATLIGAVCGGVINCSINYKWTFKAKGCRKQHVIIKYVIVWVCSIGLNTSGTYFLTELMKRSTWIESFLGSFYDDIYIISKIVVSLIVGFVWNYNMQRLFVYRNVDIKGRLGKLSKCRKEG